MLGRRGQRMDPPPFLHQHTAHLASSPSPLCPSSPFSFNRKIEKRGREGENENLGTKREIEDGHTLCIAGDE
jgi:hypothetical protein